MKSSLLLFVFAVSACSLSTHQVKPSALGSPSRTSAMLSVIDEPGPLTVETVTSCEWTAPLSSLLNLDHPSAKAAGLNNRDEPIKVFFHVVRHPTKGTFIIDTGVEKAVRDDPDHVALQSILKLFMDVETMKVIVPLGDWVAHNKLDGVMLTHLHADHVMGLPDVPRGVPIFSGPGEAGDRALRNILIQGSMDNEFEGHEAISEWQFKSDPDGRFDGIIDVFGDGSLWAILVPGHTPGHTAYVARTAQGPVLIVGDVSHTKWGWDHDVEPGSFTDDRAQAVESLRRLRLLAAQHPRMSVLIGHQ